ncbi:MAG: CopG family transcriptional regulator [Opitutales bacterium]
MRTTLTINDELLSQAKQLAAQRKSNVSAVVNEALREALKEKRGPNPQTYRVPTFPAKGKAAAISPAAMKDLLAAEDLKPYGK